MGGETGVYGGVLVRNVCGNLYLDMEVAIESEVAATKGSTATTLTCIYYVFLEIVGIQLFNNYPVSACLSAGRLDRREIPDMVKLRLDHDRTRVRRD